MFRFCIFAAVALSSLRIARGLDPCNNLDCEGVTGLFAHPGDCNSYVNCENGVPRVSHCPFSQHFNEYTLICEPQEQAWCDLEDRQQWSGCSLLPLPKYCTGTDCLPIHPKELENAECENWSKNGNCICKSIDGDCSWQKTVAKDCPYYCSNNFQEIPSDIQFSQEFPCINCSKFQLYYRHTEDCRKFVMCTRGGPQEQICGYGLIWDQDQLNCIDAGIEQDCVVNHYSTDFARSCQDNTVKIASPYPEGCKDKNPECKYRTLSGGCQCQWSPYNDCSRQRKVAADCPLSCKCSATYLAMLRGE